MITVRKAKDIYVAEGEIEVVTYCAAGEFRHADEHGEHPFVVRRDDGGSTPDRCPRPPQRQTEIPTLPRRQLRVDRPQNLAPRARASTAL
jgi:hypothetical protein